MQLCELRGTIISTERIREKQKNIFNLVSENRKKKKISYITLMKSATFRKRQPTLQIKHAVLRNK